MRSLCLHWSLYSHKVLGGIHSHLYRVPTVMEILEKIAVMESHGKVLEYENFPKNHGK